jgi:ubiquinone/menaquinone biosynthesis C-methylase UbiE
MYLCARNMKNPSAVLIFSLLLFWSGIACKWIQPDHPSGEGSMTERDSNDNSGVFENEAEQYESADRVIWQKPDIVIQQLGDVEGKVVADLGAGTGYFSRRIAYKGAKVIAIDIDPKAIQWMEEQKARFPPELQDRLVIRLAEPNDPKLKPNEVDIVLLVNTYSYIQDRIPYFTRLKEMIRSKGQVVIIDFKKKETPFGPALEERIDVNDVATELTAAGYKVTAVDEASLEYQYIIKVQKD